MTDLRRVSKTLEVEEMALVESIEKVCREVHHTAIERAAKLAESRGHVMLAAEIRALKR